MKISVDKDLCIGCGLCASSCGKCFRMGDDGKAEPVEESCECSDCNLNEIAASCPGSAITVSKE